jgi:hypothetical protein
MKDKAAGISFDQHSLQTAWEDVTRGTTAKKFNLLPMV